MSSLRYLNVMLTILAALISAQLYTTWTLSPPLASVAEAQGIPDSGAQRMQIIDQLKLLNQKTDEVKALLVSGRVRASVSVTNDQR